MASRVEVFVHQLRRALSGNHFADIPLPSDDEESKTFTLSQLEAFFRKYLPDDPEGAEELALRVFDEASDS